jgi:quinol-cytochrome oxidoreductase complex cytochrome b subunit
MFGGGGRQVTQSFSDFFYNMLKEFTRYHSVNILFIIICSVTILYFMKYNSYRKMERWYYRTNKNLYFIMQTCYYITMTSLAVTGRFILFDFLKRNATHFING